MSDTTTTLNPGSGGDVMNESLVTQSDGVTQAKSPRVVITADNDGTAIVNPTKTEPAAPVNSLPVISGGVVSDTRQGYIPGEVRPMSMTTDGRVRVIMSISENYIDFFGDTGPIDCDPEHCVQTTPASSNPWGI